MGFSRAAGYDTGGARSDASPSEHLSPSERAASPGLALPALSPALSGEAFTRLPRPGPVLSWSEWNAGPLGGRGDFELFTPLMAAAAHRRTAVVQLLLGHMRVKREDLGKKGWARGGGGCDGDDNNDDDDDNDDEEEKGAAGGWMLAPFLGTCGDDVDCATPKGVTALMYAAAAGSERVVLLLLGHGAGRSLRDSRGRQAQDWALRRLAQLEGQLVGPQGGAVDWAYRRQERRRRFGDFSSEASSDVLSEASGHPTGAMAPSGRPSSFAHPPKSPEWAPLLPPHTARNRSQAASPQRHQQAPSPPKGSEQRYSFTGPHMGPPLRGVPVLGAPQAQRFRLTGQDRQRRGRRAPSSVSSSSGWNGCDVFEYGTEENAQGAIGEDTEGEEDEYEEEEDDEAAAAERASRREAAAAQRNIVHILRADPCAGPGALLRWQGGDWRGGPGWRSTGTSAAFQSSPPRSRLSSPPSSPDRRRRSGARGADPTQPRASSGGGSGVGVAWSKGHGVLQRMAAEGDYNGIVALIKQVRRPLLRVCKK